MITIRFPLESSLARMFRFAIRRDPVAKPGGLADKMTARVARDSRIVVPLSIDHKAHEIAPFSALNDLLSEAHPVKKPVVLHWVRCFGLTFLAIKQSASVWYTSSYEKDLALAASPWFYSLSEARKQLMGCSRSARRNPPGANENSAARTSEGVASARTNRESQA